MESFTSRLVAALAYPRLASDFLELANPFYLSTPGEIRARVIEVRRETQNFSTLVLRTKRPFPHRAGQFVQLTVEIDGTRRTRCFSIASGEGTRNIEITIKAHPGGTVTPRLVAGTFDKDRVTLSLPSGDFVLPETIPEQLLLVSGGSGITPVMSMLRTLVEREHRGEVVFLHWARSQDDVVFATELTSIARILFPNIRIHVETSMFDIRQLARAVDDFENWDTWLCGPAPFMQAVQSAFAKRDSAHRVRTEAFSMNAAPTNAVAAEVTFVKSERRAKGAGSLLVMAEREGMNPKSGCRMGICHTCVCRKISGTTRDLRTGEISNEADVDIQICTSEPIGPVEIDL